MRGTVLDMQHPTLAGHPIHFETCAAAAIDPTLIDRIIAAELTGVVIHDALPPAQIANAVARLNAEPDWDSPNKGMRGGELRTIGDAATPTFTHLRGPSADLYAQSAAQHASRAAALFETDPTPQIAQRLSAAFNGRPAAPPAFDDGLTWAPYNLRALDPGVQIYSHHDNHYGLSVYERMPTDLDRGALLSWFITLQAPQDGGALIVYGLWGSDPNPPTLPTRFLDTAALESDYRKATVPLKAGDLVIFDAGRHVHRVSPVQGDRARLTLGGFLTVAQDRTRLAFWS